MVTVHYGGIWLRGFVAVTCGTLILMLGAPLNFRVALVSPSFYVAVLISCLIAFMLLSWVHWINCRLDLKYPWKKLAARRMMPQLLLAVVAPACLDLLLVLLYMQIAQHHVDWDKFLHFDFPLVVAFLLLVNGAYLVAYLWQTSENQKKAEEPNKKIAEETIRIEYNGNYLQLNVQEDILFLYRHGKVISVVTVDGKQYHYPDSLYKLWQRLEKMNYCKINRSVIVNGQYVPGYRSGFKRDTLQIMFRPALQPIINKFNEELFKVTKEHLTAVKAVMQQYNHEEECVKNDDTTP